MSDAATIVGAFMARWSGGAEAIGASLRDCLAADAVWENVGLATTAGPAEAIAFFDDFMAKSGCARIDVEMLAIAAAGDTVLTERIDHLIDRDGAEIMAIRVMGALEVADGRIAGWRDYFDTLPFADVAETA